MAQAANAIDVRLFFAALAVGRTMYFHDVKEIQNYIFVQPDAIKTMQYAITFRIYRRRGEKLSYFVDGIKRKDPRAYIEFLLHKTLSTFMWHRYNIKVRCLIFAWYHAKFQPW